MILKTSSEVVSFVKKLESAGVKFYQDMSRRYPQHAEVFFSFADENRKNQNAVERVYYEAISDAIETGFAFGLDTDEYEFESVAAERTNYSDTLGKAIEIEDKMIKLYSDAAEQSISLMADLPRIFSIFARKRSSRVSKLRMLL